MKAKKTFNNGRISNKTKDRENKKGTKLSQTKSVTTKETLLIEMG